MQDKTTHKEQIMKVSIVIEKDDFGFYAYCPELKGCHTQGETLDEAMQNIKEAITLYIETLSEDEKTYCFSKEILTSSMEVVIA